MSKFRQRVGRFLAHLNAVPNEDKAAAVQLWLASVLRTLDREAVLILRSEIETQCLLSGIGRDAILDLIDGHLALREILNSEKSPLRNHF